MLDLEACERRVFRLATLLTGDRRAALAVLASTLDAGVDLRQLDDAHLDRITVLRSREQVAARPAAGPDYAALDVPEPIAIALHALAPQQRESWVLRRVYGLDPRQTARAMDCSRTAVGHHLDGADATMRDRLGDDVGPARAMVLEASRHLDLPELVRLRRRRRRRRRRTTKLLIVALVAIAIIAAIAWTWYATSPLSLPGRGPG